MGKQKAYVATTEQVWAIHDAVPDHMKVAVLLGAFAGLRVAEVAACGWPTWISSGEWSIPSGSGPTNRSRLTAATADTDSA